VILLTTSRRPTYRIRTFCHDLARSIPNVVRINRGKLNLDGIAGKAVEFDADRVMLVDRRKGGPGKIELFQAGPEGLILVPPLMYIRDIRLRRELEAVRVKPIRSLSITASPEKFPKVEKIVEYLSRFLNVPVSSMDEATSSYEATMHVSSDPLSRTQITFVILPRAIEVGPRITISHVVWEA